MRFAINNGEDDDYADVTLQEAIARSTNPAELINTPVNSDGGMEDEDVANLPLNPSQRPCQWQTTKWYFVTGTWQVVPMITWHSAVMHSVITIATLMQLQQHDVVHRGKQHVTCRTLTVKPCSRGLPQHRLR